MSVSSLALAQPEGGADASASATAGVSAAATATKTEASASGDASSSSEEAKPAKDAKAAEVAPKAVEKKPQPDAKAEADAEPAADADAAAAATTPVSVEVLPGSGYPAPKVRGIVGGSLWLTMHGHQFPYMPSLTGKPQVRIAVSGSVWDDTSYARLISGSQDTAPNRKRWTNQGRGVLRLTPAYSLPSGWFAQGQLELVAKSDQTVLNGNAGAVDDVFVRAGKWGLFDVTVGRFQGWEVYHYGMGLDLNTLERNGAQIQGLRSPPGIYGVSNYWDRLDGGAGNYAAHVYLTDYLRLEVMGIIGTLGGANVRAVRPVAVLDLGYVKVKVGAEKGATSTQDDDKQTHSKDNGFGGAVQFVLNPYIEGGINGAIGYVDKWNKDGLPELDSSTTTKSFGGFLNGRVYGPLIVGLGANWTRQDNLDTNQNADSPRYDLNSYLTHLQSFAAIQYSFWDKLFFKFVGGYAKFHFEDNMQEPPHPYDGTMWSGRLRMMYLF